MNGFSANKRVAAVMLFLSGLILFSGSGFLLEWPALQRALALAAAIWFMAGLVMLACAIAALCGINARLVFRVGAAGAALAGLTLSIAVLTRVAPCAGPTCVRSRLVVAGGLVLFAVLAPRNSQSSLR